MKKETQKYTHEAIYREVLDMKLQFSKIVHSLEGNGAIGLIEQVKENRRDIASNFLKLQESIDDVDKDIRVEVLLFKKVFYKFKDNIMKIIYISTGVVGLLLVLWEVFKVLKG